jgi:hypothetical protein
MKLDHSQKNQNQPTKILLYSFEDPEGEWEKVGDDWYRWALPVYRMPQGSWDETTGFTRQKIWFIEKTYSADPVDPNDIDLPPWLQCYWDSQAGRWVIITPGSGASSQMVEFEIVADDSSGSGSGSSSSSSSDDDTCGNDSPIEGLRGKVIAVSCGASMPADADENGVVDLVDKIGLLDGKTIDELVGRRGFATRMVDLEPEEDEEPPESGSASSSGKNECYWSIVFVNAFVVVSVISDIIFGEESITIKRKNIKVWDECTLPDEIIEGTDCPTGAGSSGSV